MNNAFQNRLVGSIIFIALAIIFLPDFLDGKKVSYSDSFETIPHQSETIQIPLQPELPVSQIEKKLENVAPVVETITETQDAIVEKLDASPEELNASSEEPNASANEPAVVVKDPRPKQQAVSEKTENSTAPLENAWSIQLGSFSKTANVKSLLSKLKQAGYVAYTRQVKTNNGQLTKVYVGPELEKSKLLAELPKLKQLTRLNGRIYPYSTTE